MNKFSQDFKEIKIGELSQFSKEKLADNWRFVQVLAVKCDSAYDVIYSFMKDGYLENTKICNVTAEDSLPSITGEFLSAFVFENEIHDLFGINIAGIAIDFEGKFYNTSVDSPMTILTPEKIARAEKQKKIEAAMAAKKAKAKRADKKPKSNSVDTNSETNAKKSTLDTKTSSTEGKGE